MLLEIYSVDDVVEFTVDFERCRFSRASDGTIHLYMWSGEVENDVVDLVARAADRRLELSATTHFCARLTPLQVREK